MPGPHPKPASQRRRRNKAPGARQLRSVQPGDVEVPKLPTRRIDGRNAKWLASTRAWWVDVWSSPMAPEYDPSDVHGLYVLAVLVDNFWRDPTPEHAKELRLHRQCFGLEPIARRRLQWEIERGEEAERRTRERRTPKAVKPAADPRADAG